jgi:hypothetical protein
MSTQQGILMSGIDPTEADRELSVIRTRQLQALRSAAPPWWFFLSTGVTLVVATFGREVRVTPWAIVSFLGFPAAMILIGLTAHRIRRVTVTVPGGRLWAGVALYLLGCGLLSAGGYLLARIADWPYPETTASAIFAVLYTTSGPAIFRRIYLSTIA